MSTHGSFNYRNNYKIKLGQQALVFTHMPKILCQGLNPHTPGTIKMDHNHNVHGMHTFEIHIFPNLHAQFSAQVQQSSQRHTLSYLSEKFKTGSSFASIRSCTKF